jgi:hypothetical protein
MNEIYFYVKLVNLVMLYPVCDSGCHTNVLRIPHVVEVSETQYF